MAEEKETLHFGAIAMKLGFTSLEKVDECLRLQEKMKELGVAPKKLGEIMLAKGYLTKSHAFDLDTPGKRLEPRLEAELHHLPRSFWADWVKDVRGVSLADANRAIRARLAPDSLSIVVLATRKDVGDRLASLPGTGRLDVLPWSRV